MAVMPVDIGFMVERPVMRPMIRWLMVVGWMSVMYALSSRLSLQIPFTHASEVMVRILAHMGEYAILTALLWGGLQWFMGRTFCAWLVAALAAALYGVSDAWHQAWMIGHVAPVREAGVDALGIAAVSVLAPAYLPPGRPSTWSCPHCHAVRVSRSRRRGRLEWCSRLIGLAPFRCDICSHRFWHFTGH
jgi:hypothetical protein